MVITIFDKTPSKIEHFINSIELRGLRIVDLTCLVDVCRKADKNIKISFEDEK